MEFDPIQNSLSTIQNSLVSLGEQFNMLEQRVGVMEDSMYATQIKQLEKDNSYMMDKIDDLENRS